MSEGGVDSGVKETKVGELESHIGKGFDAIKSHDFHGAIDIFSNESAARSFGFVLDKGGVLIVKHPPSTYESTRRIIDTVASHSWFHSPRDGSDLGTIEIAGVFPFDVEKRKPVKLPPETEKLIFHNVALMNAEEWVHALRFRQGIEPVEEIGELLGARNEAEVAAYMLSKGVPLTREFLDRYNRRSNLIKFGLV